MKYSMAIDKLLKRFLKENGLYGSRESKDILEFITDYEEIMLPFNAFRWETTEQGHNYWYSKALNWILYLYDRFEDIDKEKISIDSIRADCNELIHYYCLDNESEESLLKINGYKEIIELRNKLS
jgi:hypothetical protein